MDPSFLATIIAGASSSIILSLLTKLLSDKTSYKKSKIKIGDSEIQFSESREETLRNILEKVRQLQESPQVFLSYSFQDKEFVSRLVSDLRQEGIKVWLADEQVKVGDKITDTIQGGISSSQWVIVILSENSPQSNFVSEEISFALDEEQRRERPFILPILIGDTILPTQLQDKQYADFRENYNLGLKKILARVKPLTTETNIQNHSLINDEIAEAFLILKEKANTLPNKSDVQDMHTIIDKLEIEVSKSDKADEQTLRRLLQNLIKISPDLGEVALYTMINPMKAINAVVQKIAERIAEENKSKE